MCDERRAGGAFGSAAAGVGSDSGEAWRMKKKKILSKKVKWMNLHSSSLSRSSIGDKFFLFGIGLTGAFTVGLLEFVAFCVVDFVVVVVVVVFVAFLSVWGSAGFVRGTADLIVGLAGRFSILRNKDSFFWNYQERIFTEHFSLEHSLINVQERFFPFADQWSSNILSVHKISYFPKISLTESMNPLNNI